MKVETKCIQCHKTFSTYQLYLDRGQMKCCSLVCRTKWQQNEQHPRWAGGRFVDSKGYWKVRIGKRKYKYEHRIVMEAHLGRELLSSEHVHHLNEDKLDNRLENLAVVTNSDHGKLSAELRRGGRWSLKHPACTNCGRVDRKHQAHGKCGTCYHDEFIKKNKK